jgi:hypothetical protein
MNELTTQQLLETLHKASMHVSHDQLKYWRRNGLLPKPRRRGIGRGMGIEQLWDEACVESVRLILESSGGKRINLIAAGHHLFSHHQPVGDSVLRRCLQEIPSEMREKEKLRAQNPLTDAELVELARFLTPQVVQNAIAQTDENTLIELYQRIKKFETPLDGDVVLISNCQPVFDLLVETQFPDFTGRTSLSDNALYRRRRSSLAWAVLIRHYGDSLRRILSSALHRVVEKSMSHHAGPPINWPTT